LFQLPGGVLIEGADADIPDSLALHLWLSLRDVSGMTLRYLYKYVNKCDIRL